MTENEVLKTIRKDGRAVVLDGDKIKMNPMPEGDLLELVKTHKPDLIRLLEIERLQDTCLRLIDICPAAAEKLDSLLGEAIANDWKNTLELEMKVVEAYARFIDPEYRAAIWGGKTWLEHNKGGAGDGSATRTRIYEASADDGRGKRPDRKAGHALRPVDDPLQDPEESGTPDCEMHSPGQLPRTDLLPGLS